MHARGHRIAKRNGEHADEIGEEIDAEGQAAEPMHCAAEALGQVEGSEKAARGDERAGSARRDGDERPVVELQVASGIGDEEPARGVHLKGDQPGEQRERDKEAFPVRGHVALDV